MAKICIVCEKEPQENATKVCEDFVIRTIRGAKQKLGVAKNNELYVCGNCIPAYREKRKKFEKNLVFYAAAAVIIFVLINAFQVTTGIFSFTLLLTSILLAAVIAGLAVLIYYTPSLGGEIPVSGAHAVHARKEAALAAHGYAGKAESKREGSRARRTGPKPGKRRR